MRFLDRVTSAIAAAACAASLIALPGVASAQAWPTRPVKLIVPFPAGGPSDIFARFLSQQMASQLGQPVVVENRSGAGGLIGVDAAAKAPPDGYTITLNSGSSVAMAPHTGAKMPYDVKKDLAFVTLVVRVPEVIVVNKNVPVKNLAELIAYAKANAGKMSYGSTGPGTITHLAIELLKAEAKIDLLHVPYKGAAPAVQDLIAGQVQAGAYDIPVVLPHIQSGALKAIAVTSATRAPSLPDVPTTGEGGLPKVNSDNWYGLVVAAATPPDIIKRIHEAAGNALRSKEVVEQYAKISGIPSPTPPGGYATFVEEESKKWGAVIRAIGFKALE